MSVTLAGVFKLLFLTLRIVIVAPLWSFSRTPLVLITERIFGLSYCKANFAIDMDRSILMMLSMFISSLAFEAVLNISSSPRFASRRRRLSCLAAAFLAAWRWSCVQRQWSLLRQVTNVTSLGRWLLCLMCPSLQHQVGCYCSWHPWRVPPARSGSRCSDSHSYGRGARRNQRPVERDRGLRNWRHPRTSCPWSQRAVL